MYIWAESTDGDEYVNAEVDTDAKTFTIPSLANGHYEVHFATSYVDTDDDGYYESANLAGGEYNGAALVDVTAGNVTGITYAYGMGKTVSGTVTLGAGADPAWKDVLEATVSIPGPEGCQCGDAITSKVDPVTGEYIIRGLPNKSLTVQFHAKYSSDANLIPEFYNNSYTWDGATYLDFADGNATGIDATLEVGKTISGTVTLPGGVVTEALDAVTVQAEGDNGQYASAEVDATTGEYTLYGLIPGSYTLQFAASNWYDGATSSFVYTPLSNIYYGGVYTPQAATKVSVAAGDATGKDQLMVVGKTISGTVSLGAGADPLWKDYLSVYATSDFAYRGAEVDPVTGAYTIQGLAPAAYTVEFDASGYYVDNNVWVGSPFAFEYYNNQRNPLSASLVDVTSTNQTGINAVMDVQVGNRDFWTTPTPVVSGVAAVGSTLTVDHGEWAPYANSFAYQWKRNGANIDGATAKTYVLTQADAAKDITVSVTGTNPGYNSVTVTSAQTTIASTAFSAAPVPTISGTVAVGNTLTAVPGAWSPQPGLTYQWTRDGANIASATSSTYALVAADAGTAIAVEVTGTLAGYVTTSKTSAGSTVAAGTFATAPVPTISGSSAVGSTLTAMPGTWSPTADFTYQWLRDDAPIGGATSSTYALVQADAGHHVSVTVTGSATGYTPTERTSGAVEISLSLSDFLATPAPVFETTFTVDGTVHAAYIPWDPSPQSFTYQWLRDGVEIAGATQEDYVATPLDDGKSLSLRLTGESPGYNSVTVTTAPTVIGKGSFVDRPTPKITGNAYPGGTLKVTVGTWKPTPSGYQYQWYRNGVAISGATKSSYKLTSSESSKKIAVKVKASRPGYTSVVKTSASVTMKKFFTRYPTPTISGTVKVGHTVAVSRGTWSPTPSSYSYKWYRNGVAITDATKSSYKLTASDAGKKLTVKVTAARSGYATTPRVSSERTVAYGTFSTAPTPKITGTVKVGHTVAVSRGTWSPTPSSYSYKWYRNGVAITDATKSSYKLTASDAGKKLTVKVTAKKSGYTSKSRTSLARTVAYGTFSTYPTPKITGTVKVGQTLGITLGTWSPTPSSYSYRWYRSGVAISGATSSTYKLTSSDKGKTMTVKVTARKSGYTSKSMTSAKTVTVK